MRLSICRIYVFGIIGRAMPAGIDLRIRFTYPGREVAEALSFPRLRTFDPCLLLATIAPRPPPEHHNWSLGADHFLTLGVDHFFLGLFFFAVPLLILVFFAFRFFAMHTSSPPECFAAVKALMPLREPDSGQPNARRGLYQCSEMHNRGSGDDLVRHGLERCGLAEKFLGPEDGCVPT
jgi:hypothetical protein